MSKRVRMIMGIAAIALMSMVLILIGLQNFLYNDGPSSIAGQAVPALGPTLARPPAYDLSFQDAAGAPRQIAQMRGHVVYLNFWASWCAPCLSEMPIIEAMQTQHSKDGFVALMVNLDNDAGRADAVKLQQRVAPSVATKYQGTENMKSVFNIQYLPFHMLIDKEGRVATAFYSLLDKDEQAFKDTVQQLLSE